MSGLRDDLLIEVVPASASLHDVAAYFERKTQSILNRYGPGPRVHYHTGLIDNPPPPGASIPDLRRRLVAAQERILWHAAKVWQASSSLTGEVLDVGCGLGGGAIFWAQQFGALVTAVTCVPSHVDLVERFAAQAGVESQVRAMLCDALDVPGENRFDAAVAIDSSGYLDRNEWFRRLASLLRPRARAFIIDCFLGRSEYEEQFNRHWHTRIGTIDEYLAAAREAGFRSDLIHDISHRTEHFWTTTLDLIKAETQEKKLSQSDRIRQEASLNAHALVRDGLCDGGLSYALMSFSRGSNIRQSETEHHGGAASKETAMGG
jgi:tocopherol O-methyltransferase